MTQLFQNTPCKIICPFDFDITRFDYVRSKHLRTFQLYHGENNLIFNTLIYIFIVLAHWNNSLRIDMLLHFDTLSWFRANQSWLCVLNTACLAEKQQIPILSVVWPDMGLNPRSTALKASTLTITPPMQFMVRCTPIQLLYVRNSSLSVTCGR